MQDIFEDILTKPVPKDSFLSGQKPVPSNFCSYGVNNQRIIEGNTQNLRLSSDNKYDPRIPGAYPRKFRKHLGKVQAILGHCQKTITSILTIRTDLRFCDVQQIPAECLGRSPIILMIVEHVNVRRRRNHESDRAILERQLSSISVPDLQGLSRIGKIQYQ